MVSAVILVSMISMINFFDTVTALKYTPVVDITSGPIQGYILETVHSIEYAAFEGIRYAKPPLGYLRFKPPVAIDRWTETFNATAEGSACLQFSSATGSLAGSEDCLFINVYTPETRLEETQKNLRPVMVWIHGGGFKNGTSSRKTYAPDYLLEKNIVYVSFNYRLGPLGFLNLNHPNATGNAGLKDQVLALKWVQSNIEKFGGNPKNVTIFGESSGAASIDAHVLSEASIGLFHGVISMSGGIMLVRAFAPPSKTFSQAAKFGSMLSGINTTDKTTLLDIYYRTSADEMIEAVESFIVIHPSFTPTIEDKDIATDVFLTECPLVKFIRGNFTKVPHMLGYMDREGIALAPILKWLSEYILYSPNLYEEFGMDYPETVLTEIRNALSILATENASELRSSATDTLILITSIIFFIAQIDQTQRLLAANNDDKPIYYYHFSFAPESSVHKFYRNINIVGPGHTDAIAYVFYDPNITGNDPKSPITMMARQVSTMWTNFAKYGNPTPSWVPNDSLNFTWVNSGTEGLSLNINDTISMEPRPMNYLLAEIQLHTWPNLGKSLGCNDEEIEVWESTTQKSQVSESTSKKSQVSESTSKKSQVSESTSKKSQLSESTTKKLRVSESTTKELQVSESTTKELQVSESTTKESEVAQSAAARGIIKPLIIFVTTIITINIL